MPTLIPDIDLPKPKVMLSLCESVLEHPLEAKGKALNSGVIIRIFETSDAYAEGDVVLFDIDKSLQIGYSGTVFYLVNEEYVYFRQNAVTPP